MSPPSSAWRDGRGAFALVFRSPVALFLLFNLTFVATLFVLMGTGLQTLAYLHSAHVRFWHMLIALTPASWLTALVLLLGDYRSPHSAWPHTRRGQLAMGLCLLPLLLLLALPLVAQFLAFRESPLVTTAMLSLDPNVFPKMLSSSALGLTTATLHAVAMVGVHLQLLDRLPQYHPGEPPEPRSLEEDVLWYQHRRGQLRRLLRLTSFILALSIVSVGALRNLLNAAMATPAEQLPIAPVMSYGLYYTGLIATIYVPAHQT
ncbi:MAG TPA: hypothetical protein VGB96_13390, partial [Archangium sp.]